MHSSTVNRRSFLKGLALSATGVAGAMTLGTWGSQEAYADPSQAESFTYADSVAWNGEYDVVVIGFGGAGAVAAKTAADEGASVLLVEKAPEGHEGGNTRYCAQMFANGAGDEEATKAYYKELCGEKPLPDDVFEAYTTGVAHIADNYATTYNLNKEDFGNVGLNVEIPEELKGFTIFGPEYPEFEGSDVVLLSALHHGSQDAYMWQIQRKGVEDLSDKIDVWFESPALQLIQDPQSKTILGVKIDRKDEEVLIRAKNGVVLSCGGFENNREMVKDYLGMGNYAPLGTLYNTGDGISMALEVGADLWHMHSYEGMLLFGGMSYPVPEGERGRLFMPKAGYHQGSVVLVGTDGYRYLREDEIPRHGHMYHNGVWDCPQHPTRAYLVYDQTQADSIASIGLMPEDIAAGVVKADSLSELAGLIGTKEGVLEQTVADFNNAAAAGHDPAYNRSADSMRVFDDGPYYAFEVQPNILNTQGGPRRNGNAEVIDTNGVAIPHLYSAGECGGVTSNMYQGGGNMAENLIFGQIAGRNAAAPKDDLAAYDVAPVEASLVYTLGVESDLGATDSYDTAENERVGTGQGIGGDLVVKVVLDGDLISNIEVLKENETPDIGGVALEKLPSMVVEAQSTDIDVVSGATITSKAFFAAVEEALA